VEINAKEVQEHLTQAILNSTIGEAIKKEIEKQFTSFNNPFENALKAAIQQEVRRLIVIELQSEPVTSKMREAVRQALEDRVVKDFATVAINQYIDKMATGNG